jgi:hypothetical protein
LEYRFPLLHLRKERRDFFPKGNRRRDNILGGGGVISRINGSGNWEKNLIIFPM